MRVLTFNILYESGSEFILNAFRKEQVGSWAARAGLIGRMVVQKNPDVVGFQESTPWQAGCFLSQLPDYAAVSFDGLTDALLLYRKSRFEERDRGLWRLSEHEDTPGWRAPHIPRVAVWARLWDGEAGREVLVTTTHLDNRDPDRGAAILYSAMDSLAPQLPSLVFGDFNTDQHLGNYGFLLTGGWQDAYALSPAASPGGRDDNVATYIPQHRRIDHILYRGGWTPLSWERLPGEVSGVWLSDHYPVMAEFSSQVQP